MPKLHDPEETVTLDEAITDISDTEDAQKKADDIKSNADPRDNLSEGDEPVGNVDEQGKPVEEIPDKYKGKSAAEIVRMHQEAEKRMGKQSNEVGELRAIVDDFIKGQVSARADETPDEETNFFEDPEASVAKAVANHPDVKAAKETRQQLETNEAVQALKSKHPDMQEILATPEFGTWVTGSALRLRLFEQADQKFDLAAADELMSMYKERQALTNDIVSAEKDDRKRLAKAAATGNIKGSAEKRSKKIYRRADIIKLMKENPERYEQLQPEIMAAYRDKRVR